MVYSTCTLNPDENELMIEGFLRRRGKGFRVLPIRLEVRGWAPALEQVKGRILKPEIRYTRRVFPTQLMEGFYVALLAKGR